ILDGSWNSETYFFLLSDFPLIPYPHHGFPHPLASRLPIPQSASCIPLRP
ncbi:hypothetical protein STEG23_023184, partial [Scotinomys teguina]